MKLKNLFLPKSFKNLVVYCLLSITVLTILFMMLDWLITNASIVYNESSKNNNIVSLELNTEKINLIENEDMSDDSLFRKIKAPSKKELISLGNNKGVEKFEVFLSSDLYTTSLKSYEYLEKKKISVFSLHGVDGNFLIDEDLGNICITEGIGPNDPNFFKTNNSILISEYIAKKNKLKVNDKITIMASSDVNDLSNRKKDFPFLFSVAGIYKLKPSKELDTLVNQSNNHTHKHFEDQKSTFVESIDDIKEHALNSKINTIYMSNNLVAQYADLNLKKKHSSPKKSKLPYQAYFRLKDDSFVPIFKKNSKKHLSKYFEIKSMGEDYKEHLKPLLKTNDFILIVFSLLSIMFVISTSIYKCHKIMTDKYITILYRDGFSISRLLKYLVEGESLISILCCFISLIFGKIISRLLVSSGLLNYFVNYFNKNNLQTGSNLEIIGLNYINPNIQFLNYFNYNSNIMYLLMSILLFIVFEVINFFNIKYCLLKKRNKMIQEKV